MKFEYQPLPSRVIFGAGRRREAGDVLDSLGIRNAIILSTPEQAGLAGEFAEMVGSRAAVVYPGAKMHTPTAVTESAMGELTRTHADGILSVGGGSTIGLGKALALRTDLPQLCVPTTYAGSEMTPILGQTEGGEKTTITSAKVQPEAVIYDPELTVTLPDFIAGPSGMNAIAHAVEALYAKAGNPVISLMAEESIRALGVSLPRVVKGDQDVEAHGEALYGAWLGGVCLGSVGMAIHHKICHTLGGSFDLPHADVHCLMIAYSADYNRDAAADAMRRVARALGTDDAPGALYDLMRKVGKRTSLKEMGMSEQDLDRASDLAAKNPYYNPREVTREGVREMLQKAYDGVRP